ncbi:MAG: glycine-rich protein, partial [Bacteroidota bacterium]|nr:glycine-rich protein [Bacteroidota bacterium]
MKKNYTSFIKLLLLPVIVFGASTLKAQTTYTFTSAGATGSVGPTQLQVNTAYTLTNLQGSVTCAAGIQEFTIPVSGNYRVEAYGAKGFGNNGGRGAFVASDYSLTAGTVLKILVGQQGAAPISPGTNQYGGGGGSFVTYTTNTPLVVAGGGGGSWAQTLTTLSDATISANGMPGVNGPTNGAGGTAGGGGGTASSADGGAGITGNGLGTAGGFSFINGGNGGALYGHGGFGGGGGASSWNNRRGGGGGGYSGGGGAGSTTTGFPEGGGGGSFNGGANPTNSVGLGVGDGTVIITSLCSLAATPTNTTPSSNQSVCENNTTTLTVVGTATINWYSSATSTVVLATGPTYNTPTLTVGNYTYYAASTNTCGEGSRAAISISVNANPTVTAVSNTSLICTGQTATLTASGANTFTWNTAATTTVIAVSPTVTTSYTVTGTDANGCTNATTITQSVSACTGIENLSSNNQNLFLNVYPNPNNGEFTISTDSEMNLSIVNNLGQVVKEISINS